MGTSNELAIAALVALGVWAWKGRGQGSSPPVPYEPAPGGGNGTMPWIVDEAERYAYDADAALVDAHNADIDAGVDDAAQETAERERAAAAAAAEWAAASDAEAEKAAAEKLAVEAAAAAAARQAFEISERDAMSRAQAAASAATTAAVKAYNLYQTAANKVSSKSLDIERRRTSIKRVVTLCEHSSYRGKRSGFAIGDFGEMKPYAIGNDGASSLIVQPHYGVEVFSDGNYGGRHQEFEANHDMLWVSDLGDEYIGNDSISSIKVSFNPGLLLDELDDLKNERDRVRTEAVAARSSANDCIERAQTKADDVRLLNILNLTVNTLEITLTGLRTKVANLVL